MRRRMLPKPTVSVTAPQSTPLRTYTKLIAALSPNGPVAQRLEQRTHNPLVVGSNPTGPTTKLRRYGHGGSTYRVVNRCLNLVQRSSAKCAALGNLRRSTT